MRSEYCGEINISHVGKKVKLCGWVDRYRNLGNLIFIDIRDREGTVQVLFDNQYPNIFKIANELRNEYCIQIMGDVRIRKNINPKKKNGNVEVLANELFIINASLPLPLNFQNNNEESKLKYRYLDLRRLEIQNIIKLRAEVNSIIRDFLKKNGFIEIETPVLTKSTPEGARDYLVPSRINKKKFYALPQSPQIFKQLLMISGFDRYYQIVKCFRDEDLRTDRQPEFTQIDIEASFITSDKVRNIIEKLIRTIWLKIKGIDIGKFKKITFSEAMNRYCSDKPDLRNKLEIIDITNLLKNINFTLFKIDNITKVALIKKKQIVVLSNQQIKNYYKIIKKFGITNFFYIKVNFIKNNKYYFQTPLSDKINKNIIEKILYYAKAESNDIVFFSYGNIKIINQAFNALRIEMGKDIINENNWEPLWIVDFPMFGLNKDNTLNSIHHPFTAPKNSTIEQISLNPTNIVSDSYDLVINGYEIGGGSVRINNIKMQEKIFNLLGMNKTEQNQKFGFFLESLKYGTPPHAGLALGLDRIIMLLVGAKNIKDVIAFPKTNSGSCLMTDAPDFVEKNQLKDLSIKLIK